MLFAAVFVPLSCLYNRHFPWLSRCAQLQTPPHWAERWEHSPCTSLRWVQGAAHAVHAAALGWLRDMSPPPLWHCGSVPRETAHQFSHSRFILLTTIKPAECKNTKFLLNMWGKNSRNKRWCQFLASQQSREEGAKLQIYCSRGAELPLPAPPGPAQPPGRAQRPVNGVPPSAVRSRRSDRCLLICLNEKSQSEEPAQLLLSSGFAHEIWVWLTDASRFTVYWFLQKSQICQFRQGSDTKLSI